MQKKKQVGIWIRVSTEEQAQGESPEHHEIRARLYAESKGWDIVTVYHLEAMSGKSVMGYPETKRMLADIKNGNLTGLIFSKLARLARNTKELLEFSDLFQKAGADLISLQEAIDTSSPAGRLFYTMIAAMAQWEREEIASRVAASIPIRAKLGKQIAGKPSMGYKWENKQLVIDEQYAPIRKLVYELFLKHRRKKTVARMLNEAGHRTQSGLEFSDATVKHVIRDTTAKGIRRVNYTRKQANRKGIELKPVSEWVIHPCPRLVSDEVWDECNRLLDESLIKNKRPGPRAKHLMAGYVYCADCESKMYVYHKSQAQTYRCYKCGTHIMTTDLEEIYHGQLKTFLLTGLSMSEYLEKVDAELQEKEGLLSVIVTERDTLSKRADNLIDMRMNNELSKDAFVEKYRPLEERLKQLNDQMPELQAEIDFLKIQHRSSDVVLQNASNLYAQWDEFPEEQKRGIIEDITDKITVGKDSITIDLSYLPKLSHTADPTHSLSDQNTVKRQTTE